MIVDRVPCDSEVGTHEDAVRGRGDCHPHRLHRHRPVPPPHHRVCLLHRRPY